MYKPTIWLTGSASAAEVFTDIALCPFEMTKVKIQISVSGTFPTAFSAALQEMRTNKQDRDPLPLWLSCSSVVAPSQYLAQWCYPN